MKYSNPQNGTLFESYSPLSVVRTQNLPSHERVPNKCVTAAPMTTQHTPPTKIKINIHHRQRLELRVNVSSKRVDKLPNSSTVLLIVPDFKLSMTDFLLAPCAVSIVAICLPCWWLVGCCCWSICCIVGIARLTDDCKWIRSVSIALRPPLYSQSKLVVWSLANILLLLLFLLLVYAIERFQFIHKIADCWIDENRNNKEEQQNKYANECNIECYMILIPSTHTHQIAHYVSQ